MRNLKRWGMGLLLLFSVAVCGLELWNAASRGESAYPRSDINGYIAWAAGGATDTTSRTLSMYARKYLGRNIILQNRTGATGAIATEFVYNQPADGYSLLFNAENPPLYKLMNISQVDYTNFYPVLLTGSQVPVVVVPPDSPHASITDLIAAAHAAPGQIKIGISGVGGLPYNVAVMLQSTSGISFNKVPFDGDSAILAALMGRHVDISVVNYSAAVDLAKAGRIRILTVMNDKRLKSAPHVEAIGEVLPAYTSYFPWGAFVGVFVHKNAPREVRDTLTDAFQNAFNEGRFQLYLEDNFIQPLGLSGEQANAFIRRWQSVTAWLLEDAGVSHISAQQLGIPRLEELLAP